ncbi:hypothetical protein BH11MYX4_BH11MYX4_03880 [soil metagenome]
MQSVAWSRTTMMALASRASVDVRTARKALEHGPGAVRHHLARERIINAMRHMGLVVTGEGPDGGVT